MSKPMVVLGVEIPEHIIDHALLGVDAKKGFTLLQLQGSLERAYSPLRFDVANRAADRVLQRLRKSGTLTFDGKVWKATS